MSARIRLDIALEHRGLAPSRARARDAILRGVVTVNGVAASKPGQLVGEGDALAIDDPAAGYVSRAALKLMAGLDAAGFSPLGKICLDLGASTGGFTQVLLERGATKVYAVDVGHGQLHADVARQEATISLEGVNARDLDAQLVPDPIALLVCDISFVSLLKVLEAPLALCASNAEAVLLIKPQFEVGRDHIGKGGIVPSGPHVDAAVARVIAAMSDWGWSLVTQVNSPVKGGDGNAEFVTAFRKN